jgi:exodeoxyribonuclease VII small subunit
VKNFDERLERLEKLSDSINDPGISLEEALKVFEEGIKLAKGLEKELDKLEGRVQSLINNPVMPEDKPELDLFSVMDGE